MRVLALAAHPDDEVLGCGGTIARHASEGHEVHIAILGEGITSRSAERGQADAESVAALRDTSFEVGKYLGACEVLAFGLPDNRFDTVPLLEVVRIIEELTEKIRPEVVYTHHGGDLNVDHAIVSRATMTALRPMADGTVRELLAFEVASSTEWAFHQLKPAFHPNVFVDISGSLDAKIAAMSLYETEVRAFPHPRSPEALKAIAVRWGSVVGAGAAEAFSLLWSRR